MGGVYHRKELDNVNLLPLNKYEIDFEITVGGGASGEVLEEPHKYCER
jgi:hypothetical protein